MLPNPIPSFSSFLSLIALAATSVAGAASEMTFAERLGWTATDRVLIVHVDDIGMSHSSNLGGITGVSRGIATSWSVMMPCPWVPEIAHYLKSHPDIDSGLHLTLTAEWREYRWGPLAGKPAVPGLVDEEGCLWHTVEQVAAHASPDEIEREIRAQIERAESMGIPITHIDSHMGTLFARPDYFERFAKVGIEKQIPILAIGGNMSHLSGANRQAGEQLRPWAKRIWNAGLPVLDDLDTDFTSTKSDKSAALIQFLDSLQPGVTELICHASQPSDIFPLITGSSAARGRDLQALTDPKVKQAIKDRGIILTSWKELMRRRQSAKPIE